MAEEAQKFADGLLAAMRKSDASVKTWEDVAIKVASRGGAQYIGYRVYRRLGAPKWAAWMGCVTISFLQTAVERLNRIEVALGESEPNLRAASLRDIAAEIDRRKADVHRAAEQRGA